MTLYSSLQMQKEIERVIKVTREETLRVERERVARAIYLHGNTQADHKCGEAVLELLPYLYDQRDREEADCERTA